MRITVISTSYPDVVGDPSGHFVQTEVRELEAAGHQVAVVRPIPGRASGGRAWPRASARTRSARSMRSAGFQSRPSRSAGPVPEIVAHWAVPCGIVAAASAPGVELELVSHGADVRLLRALPARVRELTVAELAARATRWRFVSESAPRGARGRAHAKTREALRARAVVAPSPLGPVDDVRAEARSRRERLGGRRLYVCAGRLVPSKRVDKVIDYVASARGHDAGEHPGRARRWSKPRLEQLAHRWHMDVRFLGTMPRTEALAWIGAADEVVHASSAEGLSTVVREAEHLGVPITFLG